MKKLTIFLFVAFLSTNIFAQDYNNPKYFEGGHQNESFKKAMQTYGSVGSIDANSVTYKDVAKNTILYGYKNSDIHKALGLAVLFIKAPSLWHLQKDKPNIIITDKGMVIVMWVKNIWKLMFVKPNPGKAFEAHLGARIFSLEG